MSVLPYLLKVIFCSAFLYAFYYFLLRNKYYHQYNRFYLLLLPVVSFLIPLLNVPFASNEIKESRILNTISTVNVSRWGKELVVYASDTAPAYDYTNIIWAGLYVAGCLIFIIPLLTSLRRIQRITKSCSSNVVEKVNILYTHAPGTPFSFFNRIFWNAELSLNTAEAEQMLHHELFHVRQKHSLDTLFFELLRALFWINPVFHLVRKEIEVIHEFLADEYASTKSNSTDYAELLIRTAITNKQYLLTNSFFNSLLKRRIAMITKTQARRYKYVSRLAIVPVLFFLFTACSKQSNMSSSEVKASDSAPQNFDLASVDTIPQSDFKKNDIITVIGYREDNSGKNAKPVEKDLQKSDRSQLSPPTVQGEILEKVEIEPGYPGGANAWKRYLITKFRYPLEARQKNIQGFVVVRFVVDKQGNLSNVQAISGPKEGGLRDEAVSVIQKSGSWEPGIQNGNKVNAYKTQPVLFRLDTRPTE